MTAQITLIGRLGKDVDSKLTDNGKSLAKFSLAVSSGFGDKKTTSWFDCVAWEKTAEVAVKYLKKGNIVALTGNCEIRKFETDKGQGTSVQVTVRELELLPQGNESSF